MEMDGKDNDILIPPLHSHDPNMLLRHFLQGTSQIEKQNQEELMGNHVCVVTTLSRTISHEKLSYYIKSIIRNNHI